MSIIDPKKFCFIICCNNEQYINECISHISQLIIPDGYSIDLLTITDAKSMASGYNEGMNASDAKYKIYMHQDVFILNKNILQDILDLFQNPDIGMIGIIGSPKMPKTGIMWHGPRVGLLCSNSIYYSYMSDFSNVNEPYLPVDAIDGLMMITQYDLPWREDLFTGWDFYDASQCFEFRKCGYQVVIPHTIPGKPWCLHDDGMINLNQYYETRKLFLDEYKEMLAQ